MVTFGMLSFDALCKCVSCIRLNTKEVEFVTVEVIPQFMKDIEEKGVSRLWLMGSEQLADIVRILIL